MNVRLGCALAMLCASSAVGASLPFREDFESGSTAAWYKTSPVSQNSLEVDAAAAKSGHYGLRLVDADATSAAQGQNHLGVKLPSDAPSIHGTMWIRWRRGSGAGSMRVLRMQSTGSSVLIAIDVVNASGQLRMPLSSPAGFTIIDAVGALVSDHWHQLGFSATGLGTANGVARLTLDGETVATVSGLDWSGSGWRVADLDLGEPWSTGAATGRIDFDDFELAQTPLTIDGVPFAKVTPVTQTVPSGTDISIDATQSTASGGSVLTEYEWRIAGGSTAVTLKQEAVQRLTLEEPGRYLFDLIVHDASGKASEPARAEVIVTGDVRAPSGDLPGCASISTSLPGVALALLWISRLRRRPARARRP